jgi:transcription initiation factor TFIIIB Brf1 subunit/transcription initiation factor TFIIB
VTYFNAAWYDIGKDLNLPQTAKDQILSLLGEAKKLKGSHRSAGIVVGAIIHLFGGKIGTYFTQSELAEYFGVSEVSLRNAEHDFESFF